jgi:hypothetical protein
VRSLAGRQPRGKVALIRRGTCSFNIKANNAQVAGAAAVVIYNNAPGIQNITVAGPPNITIPVVSISDTRAVLINNRLAAGPVTMTWTANRASFPNANAGLISSFSSYGLSPTSRSSRTSAPRRIDLLHLPARSRAVTRR